MTLDISKTIDRTRKRSREQIFQDPPKAGGETADRISTPLSVDHCHFCFQRREKKTKGEQNNDK